MAETTTTTKKRTIRYLNRDFEGLKRDLIEHLRVHFKDSYKDYNEASTGIMLVELMAYVGDQLSFYLDKRFNESFIQTAKETKSVLKHARQLGFKMNVFGKAAAIGKVDTFLKVPVTSSNEEIIPDMNYAGVIKSGAKLIGGNGTIYETLSDVDFGNVDINNSSFVSVADRDSSTSVPTSFALKVENVDMKAGETKTTTFTVGDYVSFLTLTIPDSDVLEIIDVRDTDGNKWYEVDYLAQDTIFDSVPNTDSDFVDTPSVVTLISFPHTFITYYTYRISDGRDSVSEN